MVARFVFHIDSEAISELASVVGKNSVDRMWEVREEALEELGCRVGIAFGMDLQIDVASSPIDGDEGVTLAPLKAGRYLRSI